MVSNPPIHPNAVRAQSGTTKDAALYPVRSGEANKNAARAALCRSSSLRPLRLPALSLLTTKGAVIFRFSRCSLCLSVPSVLSEAIEFAPQSHETRRRCRTTLLVPAATR